ncbi:MAG: hypothetical protein COA69_06715 [Robiginitomaculum sp.]|nr:MAG: hypothetical protein COA69_06715 [Robiginitomaculum sp.]
MKRGLQITMAVLSLIPLLSGLTGLWRGAAGHVPVDQITPALDNFIRFQSGIYLVIFMLVWWLIPNVEKHTAVFRIAIFAIFIGGIGRAISYVTIGPPPSMMVGAMVLEFSVPLLVVWQAKLSPQSKPS